MKNVIVFEIAIENILRTGYGGSGGDNGCGHGGGYADGSGKILLSGSGNGSGYGFGSGFAVDFHNGFNTCCDICRDGPEHFFALRIDYGDGHGNGFGCECDI